MKNLLPLTGLALFISCQSSPKQATSEIHQGYSETADQYEVDGWVISNVDVKADLWNPRGKTPEQIEERAQFLNASYEVKRTAEQQERANRVKEKYKDAIVINSLLAATVGIQSTTPEDFRSGLERNRAAGMTLVSATVWAFPGDGDGDERDMFERITASNEVVDEIGVVIAESVDEIRQAKEDGKMALIYNTQGSDYAIEDMDMVRRSKEAGVMISNFVYNKNNALAGGGSAQDMGVTELGEEFVKALNDNRIVVDVSHSSDQTAIDASRLSAKPVLASHSPVKALYEIGRNLSDDAIKAIGETNGCICTTGVGTFLNPQFDASPEEFVKHVVYVADLIGKDKTCFSTDYMGNPLEMFRKSIAKVDFYPPEKGFGGPASNMAAQHIWDVAAILEDEHGWTEDEIRGFLGENLLRVYAANWDN